MELIIELIDGRPINHPIAMDNFVQAFPHIDVNNLPENYARFERVIRPLVGVYEKVDPEEPSYEFVAGIWKDVWRVRRMTANEITAKQTFIKNLWLNSPNYSEYTAWVFNETTCEYEPPIPRPIDNKEYFWQGTTSSWVEVPQRPDDGKQYKLNRVSATWVEVTP